VAFGSDGGPGFLDFAGFADEKGTADDAHEGAAHELFFLPSAELLDGFVGWIAEQGEIEFVFFFEGGERLEGVGAHAEDYDTEVVEFFLCVAKLGRFNCSTGGVGFGKEEEEDALAGEVFERDFLAFVGLEAEGGGFGTNFEHSSTSL